MLSNAVGYVTLKATMKAEVPSMGFVWGALRKILPEGTTDGTSNVRGMQLTACGHGAVFDVKATLTLALARALALALALTPIRTI